MHSLRNHRWQKNWRHAGAVLRHTALALVAITFATTGFGTDGFAQQMPRGEGQVIVVPDVDAKRGRRLFVVKGCVTCHRVNGVGGKAAPALDAPEAGMPVNLLDFAARMWRGASAMQELQALELGYQIELSGTEIGDLAAFTADPSAQKGFSTDEVPEMLRDWFIDEVYWDDGEWPDTNEWKFPQ